MKYIRAYLPRLILSIWLISEICFLPNSLEAGNIPRISPKQIYVSEQGSDSNSGSIDSPIATLEKAMVMTSANPGDDYEVYIRKGTYTIAKGLKLPSVSQGSKRKLLLTAYKNELVTVTGGKLLKPNQFRLVTDVATLKRLAPLAKGKIYVTNLKQNGVNNFGTIKKNGFESDRLPAGLEVFRDEKPMSLARWPNDQKLPIEEVVKPGAAERSGKPSFRVTSKRPHSWAKSNDIWIAGQFTAQWSYDNLPIEAIQDQGTKVTLKESSRYGLKSTGAGENQNDRGYFFYNVFEELDDDGEFYLNRDTGDLFIFSSSPLDKSRIRISLLEEPIFLINGTNNISVKNIDFSVSRGHAIRIEKSKNIEVTNCKFSNLGLLAISASKVENLKVSGCEISGTGSGGITLDGGDRKNLISGNNEVFNCEFSDYSRLYKTYSPAVYLYGVGGQVKNCSIHDAPDQAIMFKGNNHLIENNSIYNVCYEFNDMGAIYTGRDPSSTGTIIRNNLFEKIGYNQNSRICAIYIDDGSGGMLIKGNIFYRSGPKSLKDFGAIHINGGGYNKLVDNVFIECSKAYSASAWTDDKWSKTFFDNSTYKKRLTNDVDINSDVYKKSYPHLVNFFNEKSKPRDNDVINSILIGTSKVSSGKGLVIRDTHIVPGKILAKPTKQNLMKLAAQVDPIVSQTLKTLNIENVGLLRGRN